MTELFSWFFEILIRSQGPAVRALPVHAAAGEPPEILPHAGVADLKATGAGPAKKPLFGATTAPILFFLTGSFLLVGHKVFGIEVYSFNIESGAS